MTNINLFCLTGQPCPAEKNTTNNISTRPSRLRKPLRRLISPAAILLLVLFPLLTQAANFYWVGGSGNWSDASKWSLTSGTPNNPSNLVPGSADNVYFDAGSGFTSSSRTVTVNVSTASCNSMDWTGSLNTPIFNSSSSANNLKIYGSLTMISAMTWSFNGTVYFESTNIGNTITTHDKNFLNEVHFNGAGGEWILQDDYRCTGYSTYLNYGHLNTNGKTLTLSRIHTYNTNSRTLTLGSSLVIINYTSGNAFYANFNTTFNLNAGTSTIRFTNNSNTTAGFSGVSPTKNFTFYNVEFTGPTGIG
jgi:hypothetical protein